MTNGFRPLDVRAAIVKKAQNQPESVDSLFTKKPLALLPLGAMLCGMAITPCAYAADSGPEATLAPVKVNDSATADDYAPAVSNVGGKTPTAIRDIPQSVNLITSDVIKAQGTTSLSEALRNVPGITLSSGEGGNIGDNINLRGFSARTDLFLDGMRDRGQYTRDTFFVEVVEVLKGPSSMLFGRGSTGGVINLQTKKPKLESANEITVGLGTDNFKRTTFDINQPIADTAAFRLNGMWQETESTRDIVETKHKGFAPSLRLGIGTPTEVTLSALIQRNNDIPDYGFPFLPKQAGVVGSVRKPIDAPYENYYGYDDDHFEQDVKIFSATIKHEISESLTLRNQLQFSKYETDARPSPLGTITVAPGAPAGTVIALGTPLQFLQAARNEPDRLIEDDSLYNQLDLIGKFNAWGLQHTLVGGIELGKDSYHNNRYDWTTTVAQTRINLGNPINGDRAGEAQLNRITETDAESMAFYANDQIDLGKQWKVVGGVRWDRFEADGFDRNHIGLADTAAETNVVLDQKDTMVSTRLGFIWQPTDHSSYYMSYGTSFNPTAETVSISEADQGLDPEKSRSYEIGAKWDLLDGALALNTAIFRVEKTNARVTDAVTDERVLDGHHRVDGFEISAAGNITPAWNIIASYAFLDGEIVSSPDRSATGADIGLSTDGNTLNNTPENSATLWTTYLIAGAWEVGGGVVYADERFVNNFETAIIDGYTRYDATLAFRQPTYDVRLNLQNLTDKDYIEGASGGRATPGKGRTAIVTASYRF